MVADERIAVVTGANRGLGFETCRQLAERGFQVVLTARRPEAAREAAEELGVDYLRLDVTDDESIAEAASEVGARHGHVDVLVNNAGIALRGFDVSKIGLNAFTRILARELEGTGVRVNAACPGWVRTDMGGSSATRSVEDGARGIVWAATLPPDGPSGTFLRDGVPIPW